MPQNLMLLGVATASSPNRSSNDRLANAAVDVFLAAYRPSLQASNPGLEIRQR